MQRLRQPQHRWQPYATGDEPWPHKQITRLTPSSIYPLLRRAAIAYDEPRYEHLIGKLPDVDTDAERTELLYPR